MQQDLETGPAGSGLGGARRRGTERPVPAPATGHRPPTLSAAYAGPNSFGALRLLLALVVLVLHGVALSGHHSPYLGRHEINPIAVDGFFAISGFLITRSGLRLTVPRFLWHRAMRVLPGFWACLAVVAFAIAPLGWLHRTGSLSGYLSAGPHGPVRYVLANATLHMSFYDIAGTPTGTFFPAPGSGMPLAWNGSLWTLWWELLCYLGIAALAGAGLLRRRPVFVVMAIMFCLAAVNPLGADGALLPAPFSDDMARFALTFLGGALLCLYAERVPCSTVLAGASAVAVVASFFLPTQHLLSALPMAYLCVWLGIRLPLRRVGTRHDFSYGVYIYGFPVQQLATVYGLHRAGLIAYLPATVAVTGVCAAASWLVVERSALRLKNIDPPWRGRRPPDGPDRPARPAGGGIPRQRPGERAQPSGGRSQPSDAEASR